MRQDFFKNLRVGEIIEFEYIQQEYGERSTSLDFWSSVLNGSTVWRRATNDKFEILFPKVKSGTKAPLSSVASRIKLMLDAWNQGLYLSGMRIVATRAFTRKDRNLTKSVAWLNGENDDESSWSQNVYKVQFEVYSLKEE